MLTVRLLKTAFTRIVKRGTLKVLTARGHSFEAGDGGEPKVAIRFADVGAEWALCLDPELRLGELYMDGRLVIEHGSFFEFLQLVLQDTGGELERVPLRGVRHLKSLARRWSRTNDLIRSKRNVAHHYDLDGRLYDLFLDSDRQYSCAYFERPDVDLEEAQRAKKRHIIAKLLVEPGQSVLDIGSGWGGLALDLVELAGAGQVKGITLSEEQLAASRQRAKERGHEGRISFELEDYRATQGSFDRIVSVGMFEHVGVPSYDAYFQACRRLLKKNGVMLLHTIGRTGEPAPTNPWITRYIFPGGHLPTLSEVTPAIERSGLVVTDIEVLRLHYAYTLRAWRARFLAHREEAARLYDERFCRMWEAYLAMSEAAFLFEDTVVFQIQLARRNDTVPITRGYIGEREAALAHRDRA
jgi:cyclopropane-fatty-acyl-phospholipid synthase